MEVRMFTVGQIQENTYIFRRDGSDRALIVDPGDEADKLLAAIDLLNSTTTSTANTAAAIAARLTALRQVGGLSSRSWRRSRAIRLASSRV